MFDIEFFPPGQGIQMSGLLQPLAVLVTEFDSAENVAQRPVNDRIPWIVRRGRSAPRLGTTGVCGVQSTASGVRSRSSRGMKVPRLV